MKYEKKTYLVLPYSELDRAISEEFGINFEMVPYEELMNGIEKSFRVEPKQLDKYDADKLARGNYNFLTADLLNEMCHRGKIPKGEYLVEIYW